MKNTIVIYFQARTGDHKLVDFRTVIKPDNKNISEKREIDALGVDIWIPVGIGAEEHNQVLSAALRYSLENRDLPAIAADRISIKLPVCPWEKK